MELRREVTKRTARAPAKLNLFLEIMGRRDDGYHELETLMVPVSLFDSLTFTPTPPAADGSPGPIELDLRTAYPLRPGAGPTAEIPSGRDNLVIRALELLRERSDSRFGARVELVKRIPAAAGLGGGSSDAAAALRLANRCWQLDWPVERFFEVAAELGSDVPFFLAGGPALCFGRGDRVQPCSKVPRRWFVIVKPPVQLSTAEVYRAHMSRQEPASPRPSRNLMAAAAALETGEIRHASRWMFNRLQAAAADVSPWVDRLRAVFEKLDFLGHQLTGSGSAYFGVCRHAQHARRLATILRSQQLGLVYATCSGG